MKQEQKRHTPEGIGRKEVPYISIALIIILGFIAYSNSLEGEFLWDDYHLVVNNSYIKDWRNIPDIITKGIGAGAGIKYGFYRPLQMLTYLADYSIWKLDVKGYHLTNTLLHIFVALAVFWFVNILCGDKILSLLTGILFAVHPIHTEAVNYISGRADILSVLFMLLCLIFYIKSLHLKSIILYLGMLVSYIAALLSKEYSLIMPVLILFYSYAFGKRLKAREFISVLAVTAIYILLRLTVLKSFMHHMDYPGTLPQRMPGFFIAISNYIRLLLLPFGLHMEYGNLFYRLADPKAILGIALSASLILYAVKIRRANKLSFFAICWFFMALLPFFNIYPINAYMAEHWLYAPSIGFFIILAGIFSGLYRKERLRIFVVVLAAALAAFYSYLTFRQNDYWRKPMTFYERTLEFLPESPRVNYNLAIIYTNAGRSEEAVALYRKAIMVDPNFLEAYDNLSRLYNEMGRKKEAIALYKKAIEANPDYADAYNNLGIAYASMGKADEATALFKKTIEINPKHAGAYNNLGKMYISSGEHKEAVTSLEKAVGIAPNLFEAYHNLGVAYHALGRREEAIEALKKAVKIKPDYAEVHYNLAIIYYTDRQYDLAIKHCDMARAAGYRVDPNLLEALEAYRR